MKDRDIEAMAARIALFLAIKETLDEREPQAQNEDDKDDCKCPMCIIRRALLEEADEVTGDGMAESEETEQYFDKVKQDCGPKESIVGMLVGEDKRVKIAVQVKIPQLEDLKPGEDDPAVAEIMARLKKVRPSSDKILAALGMEDIADLIQNAEVVIEFGAGIKLKRYTERTDTERTDTEINEEDN